MSIEVTRIFYRVSTTAEAVECLRRGDTLWCVESGEGWQLDLSCPSWQSKRHIRRFVSRNRSDTQDYFNIRTIHFRGSHEE